MKKKTKYYEFEKPKGSLIYNINSDGLFYKEKPNDELFSADIMLVHDIPIFKDEKFEKSFDCELLEFIKKYNTVFSEFVSERITQKGRNSFTKGNFNKKLKSKYFSISVYVTIKPSGTLVNYAPIHKEKYPKKQYKEFYGSFKIDKLDMLKFLNNYSKKIKLDLEIKYF